MGLPREHPEERMVLMRYFWMEQVAALLQNDVQLETSTSFVLHLKLFCRIFFSGLEEVNEGA